MRIVGFLSKDTTGASIIALMLFTLLLLVMYDLYKSTPPEYSGLNPAQRRKKQYDFLKEKYMKLGLAGLVIVLTIPLLAPTITASDVAVPKPVPVTAHSGVIKVAKPTVNGLYRYKIDDMRFLVVKKDTLVRAALDYCYICPPVGYGYDGQRLICQNCSAPIEPETVGNPGGCNPRVIDYSVGADSITLSLNNIRTAWNE